MAVPSERGFATKSFMARYRRASSSMQALEAEQSPSSKAAVAAAVAAKQANAGQVPVGAGPESGGGGGQTLLLVHDAEQGGVMTSKHWGTHRIGDVLHNYEQVTDFDMPTLHQQRSSASLETSNSNADARAVANGTSGTSGAGGGDNIETPRSSVHVPMPCASHPALLSGSSRLFALPLPLRQRGNGSNEVMPHAPSLGTPSAAAAVAAARTHPQST